MPKMFMELTLTSRFSSIKGMRILDHLPTWKGWKDDRVSLGVKEH